MLRCPVYSGRGALAGLPHSTANTPAQYVDIDPAERKRERIFDTPAIF